jgi:hypothetical protein
MPRQGAPIPFVVWRSAFEQRPWRVDAHRFYERLGFHRAAVGYRWSFRSRERAGAA